MNNLVLSLLDIIFIGIGATLTFDLCAQFLKYTFKITPSNICFVGRWLLYMREGFFKHTNIAGAQQKNSECIIGWIAHYIIGISLTTTFVILVGSSWLQHPTPIPSFIFGVVTVLAPFLIMQPLMGLGIAASKTANPMQARLRSLMNHAAFGAGLYLSALLLN
jgi:hypothetical protein